MRRHYTIVYHPRGIAEVDLEVNPYLPISMQSELIDTAVLDNINDSVDDSWRIANVHDENGKCVYTYFNPRYYR